MSVSCMPMVANNSKHNKPHSSGCFYPPFIISFMSKILQAPLRVSHMLLLSSYWSRFPKEMYRFRRRRHKIMTQARRMRQAMLVRISPTVWAENPPPSLVERYRLASVFSPGWDIVVWWRCAVEGWRGDLGDGEGWGNECVCEGCNDGKGFADGDGCADDRGWELVMKSCTKESAKSNKQKIQRWLCWTVLQRSTFWANEMLFNKLLTIKTQAWNEIKGQKEERDEEVLTQGATWRCSERPTAIRQALWFEPARRAGQSVSTRACQRNGSTEREVAANDNNVMPNHWSATVYSCTARIGAKTGIREAKGGINIQQMGFHSRSENK